MTQLELLAPAKNLECGIAAIDHGADAVYIGASRFGARAAVGNSVEDIRRLCDYARPFGVKVYVTVNTIIYDHELEATRQLLSELAEAGVYAILVQDMAVAQLTTLTLHADLAFFSSQLIHFPSCPHFGRKGTGRLRETRKQRKRTPGQLESCEKGHQCGDVKASCLIFTPL